jgi:hypothetical protein
MRITKPTANARGCWVDVYEKPWFDGALRRLHGPAEFKDLIRAGSLIVGPGAMVIRRGRAGHLKPKQIIPDLTRPQFAGMMEGLQIVNADSN